MRVSSLRWIILIISFVTLTFGGFIGIYLGDFLPTFSCNFIGQGNAGVCFLYPLQSALESGELQRYKSIVITFLFFSILIVILGRIWCGWICPMGFIQDVLDLLRRKLRMDYIRFPRRLRKQLTSIKWIFLFITLLVPLWVAFPFLAPNVAREMITPFCDWCPARYIMPLVAGDPIRMGIDFKNSTALTMSVTGAVFSALTIFGAFMKRRFFCAYCPMVLLISFYRKITLMRLKKDAGRCTRCGICYNVCPMEVEQVYMEREKEDIASAECIMCLRCVEFCPENDALKVFFMGKAFYKSSRNGFIRRQPKNHKKKVKLIGKTKTALRQ